MPKLKHLTKLRKDSGMTLAQLSEKVGVSSAALCLYESGKRIPDLNILTRLADVLGCSVDEIIYGSVKKSRNRVLSAYLNLNKENRRIVDDMITKKLIEQEADMECILHLLGAPSQGNGSETNECVSDDDA